MRYLFVHQNFPGQFRHVAAALLARGHEVVALGVNKPAEPVPGVRHVLYREKVYPATDIAHPLAGALTEFQGKVARGGVLTYDADGVGGDDGVVVA